VVLSWKLSESNVPGHIPSLLRKLRSHPGA